VEATPEARHRFCLVDRRGGEKVARNTQTGIRKAVEFLAGGGLLVIFHAEEVSHFQWKKGTVTDPKWNPAIARMLAMAKRRTPGISVVPVYVEGRNSRLFQAAALLHPLLPPV